jgi:serine-type D-Ala-D-Ala endopeptidase (penicillin-binding protein 7)
MKLLPTLFAVLTIAISQTSGAEAQDAYRENITIAYPYVEDESDSAIEQVAPALSDLNADPAVLASSVFVVDPESGRVLFEKNADSSKSIASITKLMTAIVVLDASQPLRQILSVTAADAEVARPTHSRLRVGGKFSRGELLRLMLMASENRAAAVLSRSFPGGLTNFVKRMNETALALGLFSTHFSDPTGLDAGNRSTARDLAALVQHASRFDVIRAYSTTPEYAVALHGPRTTLFHNTNRLTRNADWNIELSKTGFISASGQCLVLRATVSGRSTVMVILDSSGKGGRVNDAVRLRNWLEQRGTQLVVARM